MMTDLFGLFGTKLTCFVVLESAVHCYVILVFISNFTSFLSYATRGVENKK